jgi:hypothetical protein
MLFAIVATAHLLIAQPSPTPTSTPAPMLEGITLGDDPGVVIRRFSVNPKSAPCGGESSPSPIDVKQCTFPSTTDNADIMIFFDTRVRAVAVLVTEARDAPGDAFGVAFGDSPARVKQLRGKADEVTPEGYFLYGPDGGVKWTYEFQDGKLILISVDDLH